MPVRPELLNSIGQYESAGYSPSDIVEGLSNSKTYPDIALKVRSYRKSGYADDEILNGIKSSQVVERKSATQKIASAVAPIARPVLEMGGMMLGGVVGATGGAITTLPAAGTGAIPGGIAGAGLGYAAGRQGANYIDSLTGDYQKKGMLEKVSDAGKDFVSGSLMEMGGPVMGAVLGKVVPKSTQAIDKEIKNIVMKAIRPPVAAKATSSQANKYMGHAKDAIDNIVSNKDSLILTTSEGGKVSGKLPRSLTQMSEAIEQTKMSIYRQYNELAQKAGQTGIRVNLNPIADELEKVATNPTLTTHRPEIAKYALEKAKMLRSSGSHTPEEAQEAIRIYNESLKSFYRNPSYESANRAAIDAMVVNNLRRELDTAIETTISPGYANLKQSYGSLKAIEKDVNNRMVVNARKSPKGLLDFTDIYSSTDILTGIATQNPAQVARGGAIRAIKEWYKRLNDPDAMIAKMFTNVDKQKSGAYVGKNVGPTVGRAGSYLMLREDNQKTGMLP